MSESVNTAVFFDYYKKNGETKIKLYRILFSFFLLGAFYAQNKILYNFIFGETFFL